MSWVLRAAGGSAAMVADEGELRIAIAIFADPESGCEVMALKSGVHRTLRGNDPDAICAAVAALPSGFGVYFRVNPVPPDLARPATNGDVIRRRWIYVDVDPVKPAAHKDESATEAEKVGARRVADAVRGHLAGLGWPAPVVMDSGNGYGLFYYCDLPNDQLTQATLREFLGGLAERFSGPDGVVDQKVHNANRLAKLPGTWARKGKDTPDRPHRPCRLVELPDEIGVVTPELVGQLIGRKPEVDPAPGRPATIPFQPPGASGYGRVALEKECARVVLALPGAAEGRNNALNRAAFSLGQLAAGGVLDRAEVENRLFRAACEAGLDRDPGCGERGIRSTIRSGMTAGEKEPRGVPAARPTGVAYIGPPRDGVTQPGEPLTVNLSRVKPLQVDWLIRDRIPRGFITVFAGRTSVGKSFVTFDLIARLTTGREIPFAGGARFAPGGALVVSEDSPEYVIVPRLITAGAALGRVNAMTWQAMAKYHLGNTDMLARACDEVPGGVDLVLIDPPTNFLEGVDEHKNSEVRQLVMKVVEWCLDRKVACVFILHVNKQTGKGVEALNRVMGSVAWVTTARVAHTFCLDTNDPARCLWVPLKNNIGRLAKAIAYRITEADDAARVEWVEEVDTTADEALGHAEPRVRRDIAAAKWLVEKFRERLVWESEDLFKMAKNEGVSKNAIFEAKQKLGLPRARRTQQESGNVTYEWWVPADWPPLTEDPDGSTTGTAGE